MNENRLLPLLEKYIEGTLDDAGRAELERLVIDHPEARQVFWEYLEQHASILELRGEARGRALAGLEKPPTRRRAAPSPPQQNVWLVPMLIAAAVLIGLVVLFAGSHADPAPRRAPEARKEEPRPSEKAVVQAPAPEQPKPKEPPKAPVEDPVERKRRIDEELKTAVKEKPPVVAEKKPEDPKPLPAPDAAPEKKTVALAPSVAKVVKAQGTVSVREGQDLAAGEGIETGQGGLVEIVYPDQTRVTFGAATVVRDLKTDGGKRFALDKGEMRAVVAKQPKGQPMVVDTLTGEVTVVGTTLRLHVDAGTRLDVEEGVVALKSKLSGKTVTVESGHYAVAAAGTELKAVAYPIDEILLTAAQAKITGGEWRVGKETSSLESAAVFRLTADPAQIPSHVTFSFEADAGRDYHVWVRGECKGEGDRALQDGLVLRFARTQVFQARLSAEWGQYALGADGVALAGWGRHTGPRWIGGDGDYYDPKGARVEVTKGTGRPADEMPAVVRFARSGAQVLRLYSAEGPMRVDAIWLSTTQKTRPDAGLQGPAKR